MATRLEVRVVGGLKGKLEVVVYPPYNTSGLVARKAEDETWRRCTKVNMIIGTTPRKDGSRRCIVCLETHPSRTAKAPKTEEKAAETKAAK